MWRDRCSISHDVLALRIGTPRIKVTAKLDSTSAPLTALLVDYGESDDSNRSRCLCGAPSCRGRINA